MINARLVVDLHRRCLDAPDWPWPLPDVVDPGRDVWGWIETNHCCNSLLWACEDEVRRTDAPDAEIVRNKREIDRCNQARNDAVERIDEHLLATFAGVAYLPDARQHSETAGAMVDRLSILALKIHHMRRESLRDAAGAAHVSRCLDGLLADAGAGRAYFKVYRQFKMYNDPQLNPALYGAVQARAGGAAAGR